MIFKGLKYCVAVFGELPHYSSEPFIYQLVLQLVVDVSTLYCAAETMVLLCKKLMTDQDICYCAKSPFNCPHTLLVYLSVQCCIINYAECPVFTHNLFMLVLYLGLYCINKEGTSVKTSANYFPSSSW